MGLFKRKWDKEIKSVVAGKTYAIEKVKDVVFSKKIMGDGIAIKPTSSKIYSPINGTMEVVFPTHHAYGITNKEGLSILIHIGIDTVNLNGKGFTCHVKQGNKVKQGDLIVEIDIPYIEKHTPSADVLVIVTTESKYKITKSIVNKTVTINDTILCL